MKLILTADVANLGGPGDTVEVKDGYGRNFLLPRGLAIVATRGAQKQVDTIRRTQEGKRIRDLDHAKEVAGQIQGLGTVTVSGKAGQGGRLFGSVTPADIATAIKSAGGPLVEKRAIAIASPIKTTGKHQVAVQLHPEVAATVRLEVAAS